MKWVESDLSAEKKRGRENEVYIPGARRPPERRVRDRADQLRPSKAVHRQESLRDH